MAKDYVRAYRKLLKMHTVTGEESISWQRIPDLNGLDLEAGRLECDDRGHLVLNEFLQSASNPPVYAAGDAANVGPPLTPVSNHDAQVVVDNLTGPTAKTIAALAFVLGGAMWMFTSHEQGAKRFGQALFGVAIVLGAVNLVDALGFQGAIF